MADNRFFDPKVIDGGGSHPPRGRFVCTWCGSSFPERSDLQVHWAANTACRRNRTVNSPLQK